LLFNAYIKVRRQKRGEEAKKIKSFGMKIEKSWDIKFHLVGLGTTTLLHAWFLYSDGGYSLSLKNEFLE
jgi:hypothetical protein